MQLHRLAGLVAGSLCLAVAAPAVAAGPANVTLRVEGTSATVVEETPVRTIAGSLRQAVRSPVTEASIRPTSGQRTSTDSTMTTA